SRTGCRIRVTQWRRAWARSRARSNRIVKGFGTMKSKMTIGNKLIISFALMLLLVFGLAYSSLSAVGSLGEQLGEATGRLLHKSDLAGQIAEMNADMRATLR